MTHFGSQPEVAILIVTYNSAAVIEECIQAAMATGAETVVIDNASADDSAVMARRLGARVIANTVNRGFAGAVNQGVNETGAPFLLLLNPDAVLQRGIDALVGACRQPGAGAAGGLLISSDGVPQRGFAVRRFPTPLTLLFENLGLNRLWRNNPVNWRYRCLSLDLSQRCEIDQPAGAFLMFRRDAWKRVGGLDEGFYPIWFEDVDFCKRLRDETYRVFFEPAAVAKHLGAHSISTIELGKRTEYWYVSLLRYSLRHFDPMGRILTCLGVLAGSVLRASTGGPEHRSPAMLRSYGAVVKLAFRSMWGGKVQFGKILS